MSDEPQSIQVNFGRPMPLFPLEQVVLLPQQVVPLHIFEPRYRQMVEHALDGSGQLAMAVLEGQGFMDEAGQPNLRPAVCIGQIVQHEKLPGGRYNVLLQGICRAKILGELPIEEGRLYRSAMLEPVGLDGVIVEEVEDDDEAEAELEESTEPEVLGDARRRIGDLLADGPLTQLAAAAPVLEYVRNEEIPTRALLELISFTIVSDPKLRYALLAEARAERRARIIVKEMEHLASLIRRAQEQRPDDWPKGCSWN